MQYVKLARSLNVPGSGGGVKGGSAGVGNQEEEEEDEYAGGLC